MLTNRNILLCVGGGIASYKAAALASKLVQAGANVQVAMTKNAQQFVGKTTFAALTRKPVYDDVFIEHDASKIAHIDLADEADLIVVAPATANLIAKLANGIADDFITTTILAATCPVVVAPAMNVNMLEHPATVRNMERLMADGVQLIAPGVGNLACGWIGKGRLPEPEELVETLSGLFQAKKLENRHVLISAGPTIERIDPVRYLTNDSSGKMGIALAEAARDAGALVTLVHGPIRGTLPSGITTIDVESGDEMLEMMLTHYDQQDLVIMAAAVADYRPTVTYDRKQKKIDGPLRIELEETTDILRTLGERKTTQVLVGFAAETENLEHHAQQKLIRKQADFIVANDVSRADIGFSSDENQVTVYGKDETVTPYAQQSKTTLAQNLIKQFAEALR
ncbi:bifunctional phosphopantothenoylcysteine decarboxylase/phosphopantothenate--cysteine ligase CoaBC [Exiguobacterium antarcticum]|uniref:Coenzyme A biosynthesis bifunctional protein CoaBC n=1 Tax=Exiguobacterium antarcticum TaxID=132920 RepID=A0ABT6QYX1_9BACL|nr:bifunctional phosphopantothenoylcysteine decarboxylase/phosphopantothenate--cysteine ligase CoaBC [Exiguobacterium antarcticum]AFS70886.1 Coenzyme A biosynthesis bifunctional protein CoaBC [Exiguobacterium antarcticum B7]MDI3233800.1 bifunctional phosphopantothenoylcysteine decarboxylase/phosphopantothenate--cysteine ligase CoaBC [Exiguobacterium antarcticum]